MLHLRSNRRQLSIICMIVLLAVVGLYSHSISAAYRGCRADPIVWLSNGESVQMAVGVQTEAEHVRKITYTLHAPVGTTVERIVYTGGALSSKEEVIFVADMPPHHYKTDTVVTTRGKGVGVTALTAMGQHRATVEGESSEHLIVNLRVVE